MTFGIPLFGRQERPKRSQPRPPEPPSLTPDQQIDEKILLDSIESWKEEVPTLVREVAELEQGTGKLNQPLLQLKKNRLNELTVALRDVGENIPATSKKEEVRRRAIPILENLLKTEFPHIADLPREEREEYLGEIMELLKKEAEQS